MDRLSESPQPGNGARSYGLTWWMKAIYLVAAGLMIFAAVFMAAHTASVGGEERAWRWVEAAALGLSGIYFAASAFCSSVLIDDYSVNVRGVFFTSSLPRPAIHWFSVTRSQGMARTVLYPDAPETKKLIIAHCFAFDEEWHRWIASLKRLP